MAQRKHKDDGPLGLLDEDYERLGLRPPTREQRSGAMRAALDAAIPGKLTDADLSILTEFIRAKMNDAQYPLIFATLLQQTDGMGTLEMIGGSPQDSSFLLYLLQTTHLKRIQSSRKLVGGSMKGMDDVDDGVISTINKATGGGHNEHS